VRTRQPVPPRTCPPCSVGCCVVVRPVLLFWPPVCPAPFPSLCCFSTVSILELASGSCVAVSTQPVHDISHLQSCLRHRHRHQVVSNLLWTTTRFHVPRKARTTGQQQQQNLKKNCDMCGIHSLGHTAYAIAVCQNKNTNHPGGHVLTPVCHGQQTTPD